MVIELSGVCKSFGGENVIENIDMKGDFHSLAVIGPSGAGKSTLLRIIGGLLPADSGTVTVGGEAAADTPEYRRGIGFVFQQGSLFTHMTAEENIMTPLVKVHRMTKAEAQERSDELLSRFGLMDERKKRPAALSGGQQQRVAIARAIAAKPKLLLLDEPTSALDPEYTTEVLDMIDELKAEGLDFVIVTHEMGFARHACDEAAFIAERRLLEQGTSAEMFASPGTEQLKGFLGKVLEWDI